MSENLVCWTQETRSRYGTGAVRRRVLLGRPLRGLLVPGPGRGLGAFCRVSTPPLPRFDPLFHPPV